MKLRAIELEGFQSYREHERVDLHNLPLTAIVGKNHTGKSSLLDGLCWGLYGKTRGNTATDVITRGEQRVKVSVEFDLNDAAYKITRVRTRKRSPEVFVGVADQSYPDGWRELVEKNSINADPFIIDLLGMDYTTARSTWMIAQNDFGSFCEMQPAPRRTALATAFGLERFTVLADRAEDRARHAQKAHEKAAYDLESLTSRISALKDDDGPYSHLSDSELTERGQKHEHEAETYATEINDLDDPELETKASQAKETLAAFDKAHSDAVDRYHRDDDRTTKALSDAERNLQQCVETRDRAQEAVWETEDARLAVKEAQVDVKRAEELVAAARAELHSAAQVPPALSAERDAVQARAAEINERMRPLQASVHSGDGTCFACGQGLSPTQAQELLAYQEAEKSRLRDQYESKTAEIKDAKAAVTSAQDHVTTADHDLAEARETERAAERAAAEIQRLADGAEKAEEAAEAAAERRAVIESERSHLGDPPVRDEAHRQMLVTAADAANRALQRARGSQHDRRELNSKRDRAREEARRVWQEQQRREKARTEREALAEPLAKAKHAVEQTSKDMRTFTVLHDSFKPSGIPAMILAGVVEELNDEANDILGGLGADGLGVNVSTHREKARGGVEEKVMIYAVTGDGNADYSTLSGSEKFRLALALRLALARCIARRTGSPIETIVMDEGWGALDEETKHAVQDTLSRLAEEFSIYTVSHIEDVRDAFPNLIEVNMDAGTSRTRVTAR